MKYLIGLIEIDLEDQIKFHLRNELWEQLNDQFPSRGLGLHLLDFFGLPFWLQLDTQLMSGFKKEF